MKRIIFTILAANALALSACNFAYAQSRSNRIYRPCSSTATLARVEVQSDGDIDLIPCSGRSVIFDSVANFQLQRTITSGGTTGNRTINSPAGTVNFAAGTGTSGLTVTNSTVDANSIVIAIARTNDATCSVKNVVAASGSFVIRMDANCTAETSVGFLVLN